MSNVLNAEQKAAWADLERAAKFEDRNAGWNAALAFARAMAPPVAKPAAQQRSSSKPAQSRPASGGGSGRSGELVPFGKFKGQPIEEASDKDLNYIIGRMQESLADPSKERWAPNNRKLMVACQLELSNR